ncbi:MAG: DNA primase [Candidatus Paceibacterota bacterium]
MSSSVEQIKGRLNIVDVVSGYLKLQKAGINFKANCPFHKEKTPSFFVSPTRDSWHCFGCNRGGDMFSFVMEMEGVEFYDALKILASRAGVELTPVSREQTSERSQLLNLLEDSKKFYESELKKSEAVINYLKERGVKGETAKEFGIGFAPDGWRNLHSFLKNKNYSDAEMEKAGMVVKKSSVSSSQSSAYYDRFRSRIMFPLSNSAGQTVGFSGRIFGKDDGMGKYINTPQTILYDKSKILYGFDKAKTEIRKKDGCILMEGQMDVIMSHQAGVKNAVAVSGTALTSEHLTIIKRLTNNLLMCFDKDEAGFSASKRGIDMALADGFEVRAISVMSGPDTSVGVNKDPADAVKENPEAWRKATESAKNIIEFYLESLAEKITDSRELKKKIESAVLPYVALIQSEMEKAHWVGKIARMLNMKEEPIWDELKKTKLLEINFIEEMASTKEKPRTRLEFLKDRLRGLVLWREENKSKELSEEEKKLVFEAELFYSGVDDLEEELKNLSRDVGKEEIILERERASALIRKAESSNDEENLKKYLNELNELNKKLNNFK